MISGADSEFVKGRGPPYSPISEKGPHMIGLYMCRSYAGKSRGVRVLALLMVTVRVIYRGGDNNNDISMKPTTGTKCPTLLRRGGNVLEEDPGR